MSAGQSEKIDKQSVSFKQFSYDSFRCILHTVLSSFGVVFLMCIFVNCICLMCIVILCVFVIICVCVFVTLCICVFLILAVLF
jgi:hypothetical protein